MRTLCHRLPTILLLLAATLLTGALSGCGAGSAWTRNSIGKRQYRHGNYTAARRNFEQALVDNPWRADYAFNVAAAMEKQGDHLAAEKMYRHALTLNPGHRPTYHAYSGMLANQGRQAESQELLMVWAETQPHARGARMELAEMQQQMGGVPGADPAMQQAMRLNPRHARAAAQMRVANQQRRPRGALVTRDQSLAMNRGPRYGQAQLAATGGTYTSPALILADQMPKRDPMLIPFPTLAGAQPALSAGTPHMTWMPAGGAMTTTPMTTMPGTVPMSVGIQGQPVMMPQEGAYIAVPQPVDAGAPLTGQLAPQHEMMTIPQPMIATQTGVLQAPVTQPMQLQGPLGVPTPIQTPATGTPGGVLPGAAPQPVELGAPVPISQHPASAVPSVTQALPIVTPF